MEKDNSAYLAISGLVLLAVLALLFSLHMLVYHIRGSQTEALTTEEKGEAVDPRKHVEINIDDTGNIVISTDGDIEYRYLIRHNDKVIELEPAKGELYR